MSYGVTSIELGEMILDWIAKLPTWLASVALAGIAVSFAYVAWTQPDQFKFAGLEFGQNKPTKVELSLDDAVIAFDRKAGCPVGWDNIGEKHPERFAGRTLIVAGVHVEREKGQSTEKRDWDDQGGKQFVETVEHDHELHAGKGKLQQGDFETYIVSQKYASKVQHIGGALPRTAHMPPYIALNFCKKLPS